MDILVVEDDAFFAELLVKQITSFDPNGRIEVNPNRYLSHYDVAFIDIDLYGENKGIELAGRLKRHQQVNDIIFVSNLQHLVFDALTIQPFYFVRKSHYQKEIEIALNLLQKNQQKEKIFTLTVNGRKKVFKANDIYFIEMMSHEAMIHFYKDTLCVRLSMQDLLAQFQLYSLIRIHRSFAVNVVHLKEIKIEEVLLSNGALLPIGKKYKDSFMNAYKQWLLLEG